MHTDAAFERSAAAETPSSDYDEPPPRVLHIAEPASRTSAAIFASPHSGRAYPADLLSASRLDPLTLRRSEDCFVDDLFGDVPRHGAPLLKALFPRAYCDVNRDPGELDPALFLEAPPLTALSRSPRVNAGLGVIARVVRDGAEIYRRRQGQLNLSCAICHDDNAGKKLAGIVIPEAHPTGYPIYRLEWQGLGSLKRRLRNCLVGIRAEAWPLDAPEYTALELYLMERAKGLKLETPAVRP